MGGIPRSGLFVFLFFFILASPLGAAEPPGAWFLNAHDTGSELYVYFAVGGTADVPPQKPGEVLLGWSWDESGTPIERYPGRHPVRYRTPAPAQKGKQPVQWREKVRRKLPTVAVGPGRELLLLGDDALSTANALRWSELLDATEAAYRHSGPDLKDDERRGDLVVGLLGVCPIVSRPVDGSERGWDTLSLQGHARPSFPGGYHYVDEVLVPVESRDTVEVQRFLRWIDDFNPQECAGEGVDLRLFGVPTREGTFRFAYFLMWKNLEIRTADVLDLEPSPRYPAVRRLSDPAKKRRDDRVNIAQWPAVSADAGVDLCQAPFMNDVCLADRRIRATLATSVGADVVQTVRDGCRRFMRTLGVEGDPCSDPDAWQSKTGIYLTTYRGELPLVGRELVSRLSDGGVVEWRWRGRPSSREVTATLADGTRIGLSLPSTEPPGLLPISPPPESPDTLPAAALTDNETETPATPPGSSDAPPPTPSPISPSIGTPSSPSSSVVPARATGGEAAIAWRNPKLLFGVSAAALTLLGLIFFLRRSSSRPPERTSFVLRVSQPDEAVSPSDARQIESLLAVFPEETDGPMTPVLDAGDLPLGSTVGADLPLALPEEDREIPPPPDEADLREPAREATPAEPPPPVPEVGQAEPALPEKEAEPPSELPQGVERSSTPVELVDTTPIPLRPEDEPPVATPLGRLRDEIDRLDALERRSLRQTIDATHRLASWIGSALPVLREIEEGHGLARFESLPLPSRREWIDAYDTLRRFATVDAPVFEQLLPAPPEPRGSAQGAGAESRYLAESALLDEERPLRERLRRHLLAHDPPGRVHGVVLALQYLLEAFPVEHLAIYERKAYRAALREQLLKSGVPPQLHKVIGELAEGLGLSYQEVRYYKAEIGQPGYEFLENAHDRISLSARVGYEAGTESKTVVRLTEIFLFESASGAYYSGRAVIDEEAV